jgi:Zn-dependent protease
MDPISIIVVIAIVILSVIIHELAHGYVALWLGDTTAQYAGRLTLNPFKHLDLFGSFLFPLLMSFTGVIFGWAKPVPYNPYNLRNRRWGELMVAAAGPASNILIAVIFSILIRLIGVDTGIVFVSALIVQINLVLAIFNLIPIPPLDGSKILFSLLPTNRLGIRMFLERWSFVLIIFLIFFLWRFLYPVIIFLFYLFTGISGI